MKYEYLLIVSTIKKKRRTLQNVNNKVSLKEWLLFWKFFVHFFSRFFFSIHTPQLSQCFRDDENEIKEYSHQTKTLLCKSVLKVLTGHT